MPIEVLIEDERNRYIQELIPLGMFKLLVNEIADEGVVIDCDPRAQEVSVNVIEMVLSGEPPELMPGPVLEKHTVEPGKPFVRDNFGYKGAIGRLCLNYVRPYLN